MIKLPKLTHRQEQILMCIEQSMTIDEIAIELCITKNEAIHRVLDLVKTCGKKSMIELRNS